MATQAWPCHPFVILSAAKNLAVRIADNDDHGEILRHRGKPRLLRMT